MNSRINDQPKLGVLQDCVKRECGTVKTDEYTLVKSIEKLVKNQEQELELAVLDKGEYQLRPKFRHLLVASDKWTNMTNDQRKAALSRVHHIGLEDSSPNSVATINTKLVEGESAVFQQILSAGVDWITPDFLRFIAHKAEGLISEGKITELPAASAYATLIIPSRSKPTKPHIIVEYANGKVECQDCQGYSASCLCAHAVAASLKRGTLEAYLKWLVTNKRKSGGLNYSKAITFGMSAGRGGKGERPPRSRHGRQSASLVVQRNPSSSIVANQSQNYPDGAQLHDLYAAPGQPSVAAHQIQLGSLCPTVYNPPSFPIHGTRFPHPYTPLFQVHPQSVPSQVAPLHRPFSSFQLSAAAGTWHSGLSPHSYYLVALPTNVKKCYGCGDMFAEKFRHTPYNIVVKHVDRRVVRRDDNTEALVYSTDFTNTHYHPNPAHIRRKNPVFDGRVLIDLGTYQSLDEGQREMLKEHGLVVNIVNS